jgi:hypothetical protein
MTERTRLDRLVRALRTFAARAPLRLSVFLLLATWAALPTLQQARGMNAFHDAQFLSAYEEHARISVLQFGQLPLWDPYNCGGLYGLAAPQTRYATPFFLLSLALGVDAGAALLGLLLMALGMEGMYRYARSWGVAAWPAFLCAPLFPLCGWFPTAWAVGWVQFFSFCGLPWIMLGLRGALRGRRDSAYLIAIACALTLGAGGTWTMPIGVLLATGEICAVAVPRRWLGRPHGAPAVARARNAVVGLLAAGALTLGVGAHRLWPMLESVGATLRVMGGEPVSSASFLIETLLLPQGNGRGDSYFVTPLIGLALATLCARRWLPLWTAALGIFALALGHVTPYAPFTLLRRLPVYDGMRYPERFLSLVVLLAALLTACGAGTILARLRLRRARRAYAAASLTLGVLFVLGFVAQIRNAHQIVAGVSVEPRPAPGAAPFRQSRGNRWLMSHFAAEGLGALACGEAYPLPMSTHLRGDLPQEEYLVAPAATRPEQARNFEHGVARRLRWSPNALAVRVETRRAARLAINQNYHPGWHTNVGRVESWDGLLSVVLPPGEHEVALRFAPRSGLAGMCVSLVSLLAGALWMMRRPRGAAAGALCVAAGPLTIALGLALWPEAAWTRPPPRTPDGEPALIENLPADVRRTRVRFDVPLVLEGVRLPATLPAGASELPIDLFLRRRGPLAASLGIFVHVHKHGAFLLADHSEISGQLYLPRMPLGALARDSFSVALPPGASGEWLVTAGLWNAYGDGAPRAVLDAGGLPLQEGALVLGTFSLPAPTRAEVPPR